MPTQGIDEQQANETAKERKNRLERERKAKRLDNETDEEKQTRLQQGKIAKQSQRTNETEGERETRLQNQKEVYAKRVANETEEEKQTRLQQQIICMQNQRANETEGERETRLQKIKEAKAKRLSSETEGERETRLQKRKEGNREKVANETMEEKEARLLKRRELKRTIVLSKEHIGGTTLSSDSSIENTKESVPNISQHVETQESLQKAFSHLLKTKVGDNETVSSKTNSISFPLVNHIHQANVCVICDRFITGTNEVKWVSKETLKIHRKRFSDNTLPNALQSCYNVHDPELHDLLLSPRARVTVQDEYTCCWQCFRSLRNDRKHKGPGKFSIANKWAIGELPAEIMKHVTEVTSPLLATVRPYSFVMSYTGGAHKCITGSCLFYNQDSSQNVGALNHHLNLTEDPSVFVLLTGKFTQHQKDIIRKRCLVDINSINIVYDWLRNHNPRYSNLPSLVECPKPFMFEEHEQTDNVDESVDPTLEKHVEFQYYFPSHGEPTEDTATFNSSSEFLKQVLAGKEPTLIFGGNKYAKDYHLSLPDVFPLYFPFGTGGVRDVKRDSNISESECLKHYLKLSLPQFQKPDVILVISHMLCRLESFKTATIRCLTAFGPGDERLGGKYSMITDQEILKYSDVENLNANADSDGIGKSLLHTIKACCKSVPYSNEATMEARSKFFALWYKFGPPSIFFTVSPGDECSFRVQLYSNPVKQELPLASLSQAECIGDYLFRQKDRLENPGACAREFHSLMEILIECLIGWDMKTGKYTGKGIFGEVIAWGDAAEEQGRKSLHSHMMLYIKDFDRLMTLLWSEDEEIRFRARKQILDYFEKIMGSSYDFIPQSYPHKTQETPQAIDSTAPNSVFNNEVISNCNGLLVEYPKQNYRDMRHKKNCRVFKGAVARCVECHKVFTTKDLVWNAIECWYNAAKVEFPDYFAEDVTFPLSNEQIHIIALRFCYDMDILHSENSAMKRIILAIANIRFNEHDWKHKESCFKKSIECRYNFPKSPNEMFDLVFAEETAECNWCVVYGCGKDLKARAFTIEPKRSLGDLFMNTHNPAVSTLLGFNNNVTSGNRDAMYYITMYTTKKNQDEECFPFRKQCNAIAKRIRAATVISNKIQQCADGNENFGVIKEANYGVGLGHVLSGITAHLWSSVISSPMAWYQVTNGSRFRFSHSFVTILLSQLVSWLDGKHIQSRYRRNGVTKKGWLDSTLFNYIYRPSEEIYEELFENMCIYELVSEYDLTLKSKVKRQIASNDQDQGSDDFDQEEFSTEKHYYNFDEHHPGYHYAKLGKLKRSRVPVLYYQKGLPDIEKCKIHDEHVSSETEYARNEYATVMLLLFSKFRFRDDIPVFEERWNKFCHLVDMKLLYPEAQQIMQNIQNVHNSTKLSTPKDQVHLETYLRETDKQCQTHRNYNSDNESCDGNEASSEGIKKSDVCSEEQTILTMALEQYATKHFESLEFDGEHKICTTADVYIRNDHLLSIPVLSSKNNVLLTTPMVAKEKGVTRNVNQTFIYGSPSPNVIRVVLDASQTLNNTENLKRWNFSTGILPDIKLDFSDVSGMMDACITEYTLDDKQTAAFNIISSSFMLSYLSQYGNPSQPQYDLARKNLLDRGGCDNLFMFLSGPGGGGKSHVIKAVKAICHFFCMSLNLPYNSKVIAVTASTNTAAAQVGGHTIHSAAQLRRRKLDLKNPNVIITPETRLAFIDEISMLPFGDFGKTDKHLRRIRSTNNDQLIRIVFGGMHMVTSGDFFQLNPVRQKIPLYAQECNALWRGINRVVFLNRDHRYKHDPEWGKLLGRLRLGLMTDDDFEVINSRLVSKSLLLPTIEELQGRQISYACSTNKERNIYSDKCFLEILQCYHPKQNDIEKEAPLHSVIIKGLLRETHSDLRKSLQFHYLIYNLCGDDNVETVGQYKRKVDPCLKLYSGCKIMVSDGHDPSVGYVKGTTATFAGLVLLDGCSLKQEIWEGFKVLTVNVDEIDYIICEKTSVTNGKVQKRRFNIHSQEFGVDISLRLKGNPSIKVTGLTILQLPINIDTATTCHKLQGKSRDYLVIVDFNYREPNWIYVVLSRLRSLKGLYLLKPLQRKGSIGPTEALIAEIRRLETIERSTLEQLQQSGKYPAQIDLSDNTVTAAFNGDSRSSSSTLVQETYREEFEKPILKRNGSCLTTVKQRKRRKFTDKGDTADKLLHDHNLRRITGRVFRFTPGNCLYDSVAYLLLKWRNSGLLMRSYAIAWGLRELAVGSDWANSSLEHFRQMSEVADIDTYGKATFSDYLKHMKNESIYGTVLDVSLLAACFRIKINIYSEQTNGNGKPAISCTTFLPNCDEIAMVVNLWYDRSRQHYEPVIDLSRNTESR